MSAHLREMLKMTLFAWILASVRMGNASLSARGNSSWSPVHVMVSTVLCPLQQQEKTWPLPGSLSPFGGCANENSGEIQAEDGGVERQGSVWRQASLHADPGSSTVRGSPVLLVFLLAAFSGHMAGFEVGEEGILLWGRE